MSSWLSRDSNHPVSIHYRTKGEAASALKISCSELDELERSGHILGMDYRPHGRAAMRVYPVSSIDRLKENLSDIRAKELAAQAEAKALDEAERRVLRERKEALSSDYIRRCHKRQLMEEQKNAKLADQ